MELESFGKMISYYDVIVTAAALERNSTVAIFNQRHFTVLSGLNVIPPK